LIAYLDTSSLLHLSTFPPFHSTFSFQPQASSKRRCFPQPYTPNAMPQSSQLVAFFFLIDKHYRPPHRQYRISLPAVSHPTLRSRTDKFDRIGKNGCQRRTDTQDGRHCGRRCPQPFQVCQGEGFRYPGHCMCISIYLLLYES
jgi:hypothetical protein